MKKTILFLLSLVFISGVASNAQEGFHITKPDAVSGGLVFMSQDRNSYGSGMGPEQVGAGPGVEVFLKYNLSPQFFVSAGTGFYTVYDNMLKMDYFKSTLFPTVEIKGGYNLIQNNPITPVLFAGIHAFGSKNTVKIPGVPPTTDQTFTSDRYYDAALFAGMGLHYQINPQWSIHASGDYRYVFTTEADPKPKFWVAKAGLSYALKARDGEFREEIEYPIDEDELASLDDLFNEEFGGSRGERDALAQLFQPDGEESSLFGAEASAAGEDFEFADSDVGSLMGKIDQLKNEMDERNYQLESLQVKVESHEKALANVTGSGELSGSEFTRVYKSGLENFYERRYREAITIFRNLLNQNPNHRLASNCQYWIGESHNGLREYSQAIEAFNRVMQYNSSYKFDDALLMSGIIHLRIGNRDTARDKFQTLVSKYPESEYAPKAMNYLGRL